MTSLATGFVTGLMHAAFAGYTAVMLVHLLVQTVLAHIAFRRSRAAAAAWARTPPGRWPTVDVVVPIYNENPQDLTACCESILAQDYPGQIVVYLVDDGSPNRAQVMSVYQRFAALPGWHVLLPEANGGKRIAQDHAVRVGSSDLIVTIDSDTRIAADGVRQIVGAFADARVGAATGDVRVGNADTNLLTRLIDLRYWVAFNQERAAQGLFGSVLCCSGPFAVYRRDVLARVWDRYVTQTFRGIDCTYGDDRHLTNLVLAQGWRTVFVPHAQAITSAPTTMRTYLRQQLRWNKSYYRELLWTLSFLPRLAAYMSFEVLAQTVLPVLLVVALATSVVQTAEHPAHLLTYATSVAAMAVAHCLYGIYRTRDWRFLQFVAYGFIHAALLVPVRIRALSTLTDNSWGTRTVAPPPGIASSPLPAPA